MLGYFGGNLVLKSVCLRVFFPKDYMNYIHRLSCLKADVTLVENKAGPDNGNTLPESNVSFNRRLAKFSQGSWKFVNWHWWISSKHWFMGMLATAGIPPLLIANLPLTVNETGFIGAKEVPISTSHWPAWCLFLVTSQRNNSTSCWSDHHHKVNNSYFEELKQQMTKFCGSKSCFLMLLFFELIF